MSLNTLINLRLLDQVRFFVNHLTLTLDRDVMRKAPLAKRGKAKEEKRGWGKQGKGGRREGRGGRGQDRQGWEQEEEEGPEGPWPLPPLQERLHRPALHYAALYCTRRFERLQP